LTALMDEIKLQPAALELVRTYYGREHARLTESLEKMAGSSPRSILFTGMGSSLFAAYPAQAWLTNLGFQATAWETSELLYHHLNFLQKGTLVVIVSQSGESAEIVRLLDHLPAGIPLVAVVNDEDSTLARRAGFVLPMLAGPQCTVTSSTFTCSVAALMYLAFAIAGKPCRALSEVVRDAARQQERLIKSFHRTLTPVIDVLGSVPYAVLMSRGPDLSTVHQASLMFKEVAHLAAEPMSAAHFRHGPVEMVSPEHGYVIFARRGNRPVSGKLLVKLAGDIDAYGGRVVLLTDHAAAKGRNTTTIRVQPLRLGLGTLVDSVYVQLIVHELAVRAGVEPGVLKVAQNVTTEE